MPCTLEVFGTPPIIGIAYAGSVTPTELQDIFVRALAAGEEHKTRAFLADLSELSGGHSIVDLMNLVTQFDAAGIDRRIREAVVVPRGTPIGPHAEFYETACRNRGFNCRIFATRPDAVAWLTSQTDPLP